MILYPNPKINIGLKVLDRRPDNFHNIETLFYPVNEPADILEIVESKEVSVEEYGIEFPGTPQENICLMAYRLLKEDFDIPPVQIYLHKNIPVGAGLGGGSSDASHTIMAINELFKLNLTYNQMAQYAARLGSDCPFFIYNSPMLGKGRGEILSPIENPLSPQIKIKLVYPPVFVSTADAYKGIITRETKRAQGTKLPDDAPLSELLKAPIEEWKNLIFNDFEETVFAKYPQLKGYKESLYNEGALYASMSGSGSTMFGLFK